MPTDTDDLCEFISSSRFRANTMWYLWDGKQARPIEIADDQGYRRQRVSEALAELQERDIVECVNPDEDEKARWYRITELGREAWLPPRDEIG